MMHNRSFNCFKTIFTIAAVFGIAFAAPHPKDKTELNNEIVPSGSFVTKNGNSVSASWGGFQAGANLADDGSAVASAGGNGLGASAGYGSGGAGASAGAFGSESSTGTGHPSKPSAGGAYAQGVGTGAGNGGTFFDRIFAIPVNVLQSVNTYLNQKQQGQQAAGAAHGHQNGGGAVNGNTDKTPETGTGADGKNGNSMMVHRNTNYDEIFNIPITALRSVQNLLNG